MYLYELLERVVPPLGCAALLATLVGWPAWKVCMHVAESRYRKRRFADRESMQADEWFVRYFPQLEFKYKLEELLKELGEEIGVDWTRFRPQDTFSESFSFRQRFMFRGGDELDGFDCAQEDWVAKHGINADDVPKPVVDTLGDYVVKMHRLLETSKSPEESGRCS